MKRRKRKDSPLSVQEWVETWNEKEWTRYVVREARLFGWKLYHTWLSIHSAEGFPDLILLKSFGDRAFLMAVELKSMRGRLTEPQKEWLRLLAQVEGVACFVWRPKDYKKLELFLSSSSFEWLQQQSRENLREEFQAEASVDFHFSS